MAQSPFEIKKEICDIGKRIYDHGFVAANDGNISVKVGPNEFYCTPTGVSKGYMTPDMIIKIDAQGNKIDGKLNPSSEIKMHMRVYQERPDANAVVHAHPPVATAFTVAGVELDQYILPEAILTIGNVPTCDYGMPSTMEIPESLMPYIQKHDAFLLKNHGALTVGNTLIRACFTMEEVEFNAKINLFARQIGAGANSRIDEISCYELERLMELRKKMGLPGKHPGCKSCPNQGTSKCKCADGKCSCGGDHAHATPAANADDAMVAEITRKVLAALGK